MLGLRTAKKAKKYYVVDQVQNGLWYQVGYFHAKESAEAFRRTVPGKTQIVRTFAGHSYPVKHS